jgi:hypothetical protein
VGELELDPPLVRGGFMARLLGRFGKRAPAPRRVPDESGPAATDPEAEARHATEEPADLVPADDAAAVVPAGDAALEPVPAAEIRPEPVVVAEVPAEPTRGAEVPPEPRPLKREAATTPESSLDPQAALTAALDSLGQAHHRPFSRA